MSTNSPVMAKSMVRTLSEPHHSELLHRLSNNVPLTWHEGGTFYVLESISITFNTHLSMWQATALYVISED